MSCEAIIKLPDEAIDRVIFFRRAEIKVDPVWCEVHVDGVVLFASQEDKLWMQLIERLERLPGFMSDWFATVSEPPYPRMEMVVYERPEGLLT
ncbi:MAG: hypothetical protein KDE55_14135 [Novosphingobium sp.]|nr:hypothetical protein [Novosphingobium sp.]